LFILSVAQWRVDRKAFSSSFNQVMVRGFIPIFCQIADRMITKMRNEDCNGREIDIIHYTERCTISMILASSFDVFPEDMQDPDKRVDDVATATKTWVKICNLKVKKPLKINFQHFNSFKSTF
jgi:cytochrome P450